MFASSSIKMFDVGGTAVRVHPTFFLLLIWIGALQLIRGGLWDAVTGIAFVIVLFACVVLHEFGHILMARRFGIATPDVTLLPIGGVASMERMPEKPREEILVALAGPAVNLVIAALLMFIVGDRLALETVTQIESPKPDLLLQIAVANLVLVVFNLIPAFPMDGGRVLRAVLTLKLGYTRATRIAATFGQALAVLFGVVGLLGNPFLVLIAIFIFLAASGEANYVEMKDQARGHTVRDAMIANFEVLATNADVDAAAALLLRTTQQEFPVVDGAGALRGVLTREALVEALTTTGGRTSVLDVMVKDVPTVSENSALEPVMKILMRNESPAVAVVDAQGRLIGYVNQQNLAGISWFVPRSRSPPPEPHFCASQTVTAAARGRIARTEEDHGAHADLVRVRGKRTDPGTVHV
jgi:Zn-dependent protease/CBS domain-containing protein